VVFLCEVIGCHYCQVMLRLECPSSVAVHDNLVYVSPEAAERFRLLEFFRSSIPAAGSYETSV